MPIEDRVFSRIQGEFMFRTKARIVFICALFILGAITTFAQERAGGLEGRVRDPNGAVVPNAQVSITSVSSSGGARPDVTIGFKRDVTTDDDGFFRVLEVPPGFYSITVNAGSGFSSTTLNNVQVVLGKNTPVDINLTVGEQNVTVDVSGSDVVAIDPADTKIQTNITAQTAELLPKGTNFTSLLQVAPAVRNEPLGGGFQIDGSSGSENTFIIDGQEVTNFRTGSLNNNFNLPFSLVQEVQVKSSGFEAEFGGATGGVINVVTRGGANDFHGEFGMQFRPSRLQPAQRQFLSPLGDGTYITPVRDSGNDVFPIASFSGPIIKDRFWFFGAYSPQYLVSERTIRTLNPTTNALVATETYRQKITREYAFARLDAQVFQNLRVTGTYTYNPIVQEGILPGFNTLFDPVPSADFGGTTGLLRGAAFQNQRGGRQNANQTTGQIVWTPSNSLILSVRGGHNFLNEKLDSYGVPAVGPVRFSCSTLSTQTPPPQAGCVIGQSNGVPVLQQLLYDASTRDTVDADITYIGSFLGRHELKGGYQYNGLSNKVDQLQTPQVILRYGVPIGQLAGRDITPTAGAIGSGQLRRFSRRGDVSSNNQGIFIQDRWQPVNRLAINIGVRAERENVPSFAEGAPDLEFNFGDKIAPRIGVAFDLTGDGKTKISAFYGWFYDRFKYELPRGSFGGEFFRDDYFEIFAGDGAFTSFTPGLIIGNFADPIGGACPQTGFLGSGRTRCQIDRRIPSNSGLGAEFGAIDPDIKAFRQSEFTVNVERDLSAGFLVSGRYTHKQVDRAIEDAGFLTSTGGEAYIIGNPGRGLARQVAEANGFLALEPERKYDAFEVRLDKRFASDYYFNVNYTYSRLFGNYSGLASSDEDGRVSPNVNRFFDLPFAGFTAAGGPDNGRLPTDRPHALKFYGAYSLDWNKRFGVGGNSTEFSLFTTAQSGTPLTTEIDVLGIDTVPLFGRGNLGRTEMFTQTDVAIRHKYRFGRDGRFTIVGEFDILNLFNEANELDRFTFINGTSFSLVEPELGLITEAESELPNALNLAIARFQRNGAQGAIIDFINNPDLGGGNDPRYRRSSLFQAPREIRFGFRFLF